MNTAHLLVHIRITPDQPFQVVTGVGIYSEAHPTTMGGSLYAQILEMRGNSYQEAHDAIMEYVRRVPSNHWMLPWLDPSPGAWDRKYRLGALAADVVKKVAKYLRARERQA